MPILLPAPGIIDEPQRGQFGSPCDGVASGQWLLESKSLKLFVASFRNHGAFHEDCTVMIGKRIANKIKPKYLRIGGYWYPRGGIPIDVF